MIQLQSNKKRRKCKSVYTKNVVQLSSAGKVGTFSSKIK